MKSIWILASAEEAGGGEVITSEEVGSEQVESTTQTDGSTTSGQPPEGPGEQVRPQWMQFLPFILLFVLMYMLLFRGPRKKQQEHQKMVQALQKNDKVRTIGGILGTVIDVKEDEVILKVDESNNTKVRLAPGAVSKVLSSDRD